MKKKKKNLVKDQPQIKIYIPADVYATVKKTVDNTGIKQNRLILDAIKKYIVGFANDNSPRQ